MKIFETVPLVRVMVICISIKVRVGLGVRSDRSWLGLWLYVYQ